MKHTDSGSSQLVNGEDSDVSSSSTSVDVNSNVTNFLHVDAYVQREIIQ